MTEILELMTPGIFSLQYMESIPPVQIGTLYGQPVYAKLTELIIPIVFDKPCINVSVTTNVPTGKIWDYAGKLRQVVPTVLGSSIVEEVPLSLVQRNSILFSKVSTGYTLRYKPPRWFISVSIGIHQYEGDISSIDSDLARIESKIDALGSPP